MIDGRGILGDRPVVKQAAIEVTQSWIRDWSGMIRRYISKAGGWVQLIGSTCCDGGLVNRVMAGSAGRAGAVLERTLMRQGVVLADREVGTGRSRVTQLVPASVGNASGLGRISPRGLVVPFD